MTIISYRINGYINDDVLDWLRARPGFVAILQSSNYHVLVRYDHTLAQQDSFRILLRNKVSENPDELIKNEILFTDALLYTTEKQQTKTALPSTYVDLFPDFNGRPFVADLTGYTVLATQVFWDKAGSAATHSLRIINHSNELDVLYETNLNNGITLDASTAIPQAFSSFKGQLRIQVKGADNPIFHACRLYLRR